MRTPEDFNKLVKSGENMHALAKKITNDFISHKNINLAINQHKWFNNYRIKFLDSQYDLMFYSNLFLLEYYEEPDGLNSKKRNYRKRKQRERDQAEAEQLQKKCTINS
jgi:hypothetical protein